MEKHFLEDYNIHQKKESRSAAKRAEGRSDEEETNMKVSHQKLIGYQDIFEPDCVVRQVRSFCIVEPCGPFISDIDGDVMRIKLIEPKDYKRYFDWGEIGERVMKRAVSIRDQIIKEKFPSIIRGHGHSYELFNYNF